MSGPSRILDVVPRYRTGADGVSAGHYTVYHDDLRAAAARLGHDLTILAGRGQPRQAGVDPCLDVSSPAAVAASVAEKLVDGDLVMMYEGTLRFVEAFVPIARDNPGVRFVINLFKATRLVPRAKRGPLRRRGPEPVDWTIPLPPNLVVSGETERRAELAIAKGVPCAGVWRLHSRLWDAGAMRPEPEGRGEGPLRVLIPLSDRSFDTTMVRDIASVVIGSRRWSAEDEERGGGAIHWTITGAASREPSVDVWIHRLARLGVRGVPSPPALDDYLALFRAHDVVWIPQRSSYLAQTSAKTLDALVCGLPVVARTGTWPASESSRWTGVDTSYDDPEEAVQTFAWLAEHGSRLTSRLLGQTQRTRRAYSPQATLANLLDLAGWAGAGAPELPRVDPASRRVSRDVSQRFAPSALTRAIDAAAARSIARVGLRGRVRGSVGAG